MSQLQLRELHQAAGAHFTELNGQEVVAGYGPLSSEYQALTTSAGLLDLSFRGRICLLGQDRVKFLHGQVTNDVKGLGPGSGCYAALVNAKAKMEADLFVYQLPEELLLDFEPGLTEKLIRRLEKYIVADDVQLVDVAPHFGLLSVQGPAAAEILQQIGFKNLPAPKYGIQKSDHPDAGEVYLANNPRLGSIGFDLYVSVEKMTAAYELLRKAVAAANGSPVGLSAFETARIESGIPRFGADMDETNLPPEAGLDKTAVSYTKGCYIGQEIIARIRTYGQVAKALRLLQLQGASEHTPARGTKLLKDGREVGYITSASWSPKFSSPVALGYVRKEANHPGTVLELAEPAGARATIL